jgi:hypothetical protein
MEFTSEMADQQADFQMGEKLAPQGPIAMPEEIGIGTVTNNS